MLRWRLLLGTVFILALVALVWLEVSTSLIVSPLFVLALLLSIVAADEVLGLLKAADLHPLPWVVYGGSFAVVASNGVPLFWPGYPADCPLGRLGWPLSALVLGLIVAFIGEMRRYERPGGVIVQLSMALFALVYVGILFSFLIQLRMFPDRQWGMVALVSLLIVVKMADIGAYTTGRLFGRHKMAPVLSPGKTHEGLVGGLAFSTLASVAVFGWLSPWMTSTAAQWSEAPGWIAYGLIIGAAGTVGDLAESLFKRDMGRKDSSTWMPGFGGVLDILDSPMLAAPVAYLCWVGGLVGP